MESTERSFANAASGRAFVCILLGLVVSIMSFLACTDDPGGSQTAGGTGPSSARAESTFDLPQGGEHVDLNPSEFTADITNPWWPMEPGTRWTYREIDEDGAELKIVVIATAETKEIANGIIARVVRDAVTEDGELIEDTKDWYAQDSEGNVWYLGEETAEFEDGELVTREGSFEAGVDGAQPGIIMPAHPQPGMKYRQEYYEGKAEDNGEILSLTEKAEVPYGHFDDVLLTKDTITIEPDVLEYKFYARGIGPVLVFGVSGGGGREELIRMDRVPESGGTGPLGRPNG